MNIKEIEQNPVRDYRSVERENTAPTPCIPLGRQPVFHDWVAFLRNAGVMCGYNFLPSDIPYGNTECHISLVCNDLWLNLTAMAGCYAERRVDT